MTDKEIIKKIFICPAFLFSRVEKWLKEMSLKGWHLIRREWGCVYYFEKGEEKEKVYFVWESTTRGEGKYSIPLRYPNLMRTYGIKKKKSKLNKHLLRLVCNFLTEKIALFVDKLMIMRHVV